MLAVITPTLQSRSNVYDEFVKSWSELFKKHNVLQITIFDGDDQLLTTSDGIYYTPKALLGENADLIYSHDTACKNLGLYYAMTRDEITEVLILDDDVRPNGDTIADHLAILGTKTPLDFMTTMIPFPRGVPYKNRNQAEVTVSHGVWYGVPDLDAPTQLVSGITPFQFMKYIAPKGVHIPFCGMNVMVSKNAIPYLYFAPPYKGKHEHFNRADDIWAGYTMKNELDTKGQAIATGFSSVNHDRASNVFSNLQKEALFISLNEQFYAGEANHPYFVEYLSKYSRWKSLLLG